MYTILNIISVNCICFGYTEYHLNLFIAEHFSRNRHALWEKDPLWALLVNTKIINFCMHFYHIISFSLCCNTSLFLLSIFIDKMAGHLEIRWHIYI